MSDSFLVIALLVAVAIAIILWRLSSSTVREITIPFEGSGLPRNEVRAALERMGCVVSDDGGGAVTGLTPGDALSFGQVLTIRAERGHLRVRSSFSDGQAWRGSKNQENVDRFRVEWERRNEVGAAAADPAVRAASEARARDVARRTIWSGGFAVAAGLGILLVVFLVPSREGASPGGKFYLAGLGAVLLGYGIPRVRAAAARLRKKPD